MKSFNLKIEDYFEDLTAKKKPGFALTIVKDKDIVFQGCYGYSNLEHNITIDQDSMFYLCSLSKQFTATCLSFLIIEGKISLDDLLIDYFHELPQAVYGNVKIKHLVHMCSGIHEWYDIMEFSGSCSGEYPWRESIISLLQSQRYLSFQPGEKFIYCNTNYALLTLIIEKIIKGSLIDFANTRIFQPLGMNNTFFCEDNSQIIPKNSTGYLIRRNSIKKANLLPPPIRCRWS
jgi:CubicO group peptidase (beta-lactamase class C family)